MSDLMVDGSAQRLEAMSGLLEHETKLYAELLDLARQKRDTLINGQLGDLERLLISEQEILKEIATIEEDRYALQCDIARAWGKNPTEMTVSRLAEMADPAIGSRLKENQKKLVRLIHELSTVNQCNSELIQQSLAYINFAMETLAAGLDNGAATYSGAGTRRRIRGAARFLNKNG